MGLGNFVAPQPFVTSLPTPPATISAASLPAPAAAVALAIPNRKPSVAISEVATSSIGGAYTAQLIDPQKDQPVYSGVGSPASYNDFGVISAPAYSIYTQPPTVPSIVVPELSASRPEASFLEDFLSAGLSTVSAPTIDVIERTQLAAIKDLTYSPAVISLFDEAVPLYAPYTPYAADVGAAQLPANQTLENFVSDLDGYSNVPHSYDPLLAEKLTYAALEETRAKEKIFADAAARGFSLPNGTVSGALTALTEASVRARDKANNEAYEEFIVAARKTYGDRINSLVAGVKLTYSRALGAVEQQIKLLRLNVQLGAEVYNSAVEAYNKQAQVVREYVGAYRAYVSALATQDEAVVATIALSKAKLQTEQVDWAMYSDQLDVVQTAIDVNRLSVEQAAFILKEFEQKVRGYQQNAELAKINIEAFGQHVRALNERVQVQVAGLEMFKDEAESAASQVGVAEANIGAYNSFIEADASRVQSFARAVSDSVSVFSALAGEYQEYGQAHRSYLQAVNAGISATASVNRAAINAAESAIQADAAIERAKIEVGVAKDAQSLAEAEFNMRSQAIVAQAFAEQARINSALAAARATAASSVAQAAASTTSISSRISDDGNYNERYSDSGSFSVSEIGRRGWSQTTKHEENAA